MSFLAHWMMPTPMSSSAPPSVMPKAKFCADQPRNVVVVVDREVRDAEADEQQAGDQNIAGDLALGALGLGRVDVLRTVQVLGKTRIA